MCVLGSLVAPKIQSTWKLRVSSYLEIGSLELRWGHTGLGWALIMTGILNKKRRDVRHGGHTCGPSHWGGWSRKIAWAQEFRASLDHVWDPISLRREKERGDAQVHSERRRPCDVGGRDWSDATTNQEWPATTTTATRSSEEERKVDLSIFCCH
jgi:hypothetical protein